MSSPFADILNTALDATPGAIGSAFAAYDGEMVEWVASSDKEQWAFLTAHYGVLIGHIQKALLTFHYGGMELLVVTHAGWDVLVSFVTEGYYVLMAVEHPAALGRAMTTMIRAADSLRQEMS